MKYVLFYESVDDFRPKAIEHFPEHQKRFMEFHARGELLMIGPMMDGSGDAMGIFTTQRAAEEFASSDPFVLNGVVREWRVREWNEALYRDPDDPSMS
jgi:hypothetical protein